MPLLTIQSLKKRLGLSDTDDDSDLSDIVAESIAVVNAYLGYDPTGVGVTVALNPNGGRILTIPQVGPNAVATITSVHEDYGTPPTFDATTLLTAGTDYRQEREGGSALVRLNANWPAQVRREEDRLAGTIGPGCGWVQVVYTVSNAAVLAVAKRAALAEALAQWNFTNGGMGLGLVTTDSMDGASVTINTNAVQRKQTSGSPFLSPAVAAMLDPFRKLPFA